MFIKKVLGKMHLPHNKNTAGIPAMEMPPPSEVLIPMSQHIGAPATPVVKAGDEVKVGQKIAECGGFVSSPIYASISGKVGKIEEYLKSDGKRVPAIRIVSDGEMTPFEGIEPPIIEDLDGLVSAARESGVVGLGGAGFPLAVKFEALKKGIINTIVINGAECEPYITSDTQTMLEDSERIRVGIELFERFSPSVERFIFGIEKNKPECIKKLTELFADKKNVTVKALPPRYPQGAEKVLIYNTTGRIVPEGKLPSDVGVIVMNVTTLAAFTEYCVTGMPLITKRVTVDGDAVSVPKNLKVAIGTPIVDVIEFCGGVKDEKDVGKILYGGPMMGVAASSSLDPVLKTTNALTVLTKKASNPPKDSPCIHCGRCVDACPHLLTPYLFSKALSLESKEEKIKMLEKNKIMICMECGCCSYVCPAGRPLVENNKLAKMEYREYLTSQNANKN